MDCDNQIDAINNDPEEEPPLQCFVVVDPALHTPSLIDRRIQVIREFVPKIPMSCEEAKLGDGSGSFDCLHYFPGIPKRKFHVSEADKERAEQHADRGWPIQGVYRDASQKKLLIYYEGWTSFYLEEKKRTEVKTLAPFLLDALGVREKFVKARATAEQEDPNNEERWMFVEPKAESDPSSSFWHFEDLTYFHSIINYNHDLADVFYMALYQPKSGENPILPPVYAYTAVNIVYKDAYNSLMAEEFNRSFDDLLESRRRLGTSALTKTKTVCSGINCVCDQTFHCLYAELDPLPQNLKYKANGKLDLNTFDPEASRVVMECSDRCGCDANCPRRALQKGQKKPLFVNYKPNFGYGLFAGKRYSTGELICEYTGKMILNTQQQNENSCPENGVNSKEDVEMEVEDTKDTSYEVGFSVMTKDVVICALDMGNIARFANHSCSPNAIFVEVHSRRSEEDALIPRIALFASKEIPLGGEVTISYWTESQLRRAVLSDVLCKCGAVNCFGYLPATIPE